MHRICLSLGFTKRKQGDMRTAIDITHGFRRFVPHDPIRYDFVLTRLGIRDDMDLDDFLKDCARDTNGQRTGSRPFPAQGTLDEPA